MTCVVPSKGVHSFAVKRLSKFILATGLVQFSYRPDKEQSIVATVQEACKMSRRKGVNTTPKGLKPNGPLEGRYLCDFSAADVPSAEEDPVDSSEEYEPAVIGAPEHSHPGESQSNGAAEAAVKSIVSLARTLKAALEARLRLSKPIPCSHAIVHWLFEHAAWILSKCVVDGEGKAPYGLLHGREAR